MIVGWEELYEEVGFWEEGHGNFLSFEDDGSYSAGQNNGEKAID